MARVLMIGSSEDLFATLRDHRTLREHEVETCDGIAAALRRLRQQPYDVLLTDPQTTVSDSLAVAAEASLLDEYLRIITLWPAATNQQIIDAIRANVFACFTEPFVVDEIADMVRTACAAPGGPHGIEVISGLPHWLTLRVACHLVTVERLTRFMHELQANTIADGDLLIAAFRELLLNAMEHGAGFDARKTIQVTAAKTARAIVYHFKDPGEGFDAEDLAHAASSHAPEDIVASALVRAEKGMRPGGFGMLIARHVADELVFNERRNEVLLIKHLS